MSVVLCQSGPGTNKCTKPFSDEHKICPSQNICLLSFNVSTNTVTYSIPFIMGKKCTLKEITNGGRNVSFRLSKEDLNGRP